MLMLDILAAPFHTTKRSFAELAGVLRHLRWESLRPKPVIGATRSSFAESALHGRLLRPRSEVARHRLHRRFSRRRCNRHRLRGASQAQRCPHRPLAGRARRAPRAPRPMNAPRERLRASSPRWVSGVAGFLVGVVCVGGLVRWHGFFSDGDGPEAGLSDPNHGPLAAPRTNTSEANAQKIQIALWCCGLVLNLYAPRMPNMRGPSITIGSYKLGLQPFRGDVVVPGCLAWQRCGICVGLRHPELRGFVWCGCGCVKHCSKVSRHAREAHLVSRRQLRALVRVGKGARGVIWVAADHSQVGRSAARHGLQRVDEVDTERKELGRPSLPHL